MSFEKNQSLIIYDEIFHGVYRAKNYAGIVGLVASKYFEFYQGIVKFYLDYVFYFIKKDEPEFVKSVYVYDGLDDQELSFPPEAYIRLLRKNADKKKIDNEEWWEGVFEDKIGFFPSIFVQAIDNVANGNQSCELPSSPGQRLQILENNLSPFTDNQKVPQ